MESKPLQLYNDRWLKVFVSDEGEAYAVNTSGQMELYRWRELDELPDAGDMWGIPLDAGDRIGRVGEFKAFCFMRGQPNTDNCTVAITE